MTSPPDWTRRRFLSASASLAALSRASWSQLPRSLPRPSSAAQPSPSTEALPTSLPPLPETARPLRYTPEARAFRIHNGRELFNRPLYSPETAFRVDAGDLPEFSLYLPGHGGNLRIGIARPTSTTWLLEAEDIVARYTSGQMLYTIRDPLLGKGALDLHLVTMAQGGGLHLAIHAHATPPDLILTWAFGGVSGRRGRANGDLGLEIEPVSRFFQLRPTDCTRNSYILHAASAELKSEHSSLHLTFPPGSRLHLADSSLWNQPREALDQPTPDTPQPILVGSVPLDASGSADTPTLHLLIRHILTAEADPQPAQSGLPADPSIAFADRTKQLAALSGTFHISTPDPFLNASADALLHASNALWDEPAGCLREGAVALSTASPGWRGAYTLDALGSHDRMRRHLRHWIAQQDQTPLPASQDPDAPVTGPADPGTHLTRKESLLHTSGNLTATGHNDRNLAFFDALIRHLRWTGDAGLAREIWPALTRHMDWQYRTFRRLFTNPDTGAPPNLRSLPLYESYASIPNSDNLPYNGAGVTHATAANFFLNRSAATLARILGEDPAPFAEEAGLLRSGLEQLLWIPEAGAFAESRDLLLPQSLAGSPALPTASRAIDAELTTPRQAWQIATDRLSALRPIPVHGEGVPPGPWFLLPTSDWLPHTPSLITLSLAEDMHFSLALWQAGLPEEAFALFSGNLLDSMFQGLCPGNLHSSSQLDPFRQETERDLADPIGITSRALVEGLFGILPDLLRATLTIRPGFPSTWNEAALHHPDIDLTWRRDGLSETLEITSRLPHNLALTLILPARSTSDPVVLSNGLAFPFAFDPDATGAPRLVLTNFPAATTWKVDIHWHGHPPPTPPARATCRVGDPVPLPAGISPADIDDPQACLQSGIAAIPGRHAVFVSIHQGSCRYWLPIALDILPALTYTVSVTSPIAETYDPIDLTPLLRHNLTDILTRDYTTPRSPFCSLALPDHLLGTSSDPIQSGLNLTPVIDDTGLRSAHGTLHVPTGDPRAAPEIPFSTPAGPGKPNCRLLSFWQPDHQRIELSLSGQAQTLFLLMTGTTFPQASRSTHGNVTVLYTDGATSVLPLRTPDTWWPIDQDFIPDGCIFRPPSPLPPRIDLRTGLARILNPLTFNGRLPVSARPIPGGAATLLRLPLQPDRSLASLQVECTLYGVVLALLSATLAR